MAFDIASIQGINRLNLVSEVKLAKTAADLYLGQVLKTFVVNTLPDDQVVLNINGQNISAKTNHQFTPGETLQVQVMQGSTDGEEIILKVLPDPAKTVTNPVQTALLHALPRQVPANQLLSTLSQIDESPLLPESVKQQVTKLLSTLTPLSQLPQQMAQTIRQSGYFLEGNLLNLANVTSPAKATAQIEATPLPTIPSAAPNVLVQNDFQAQSLKLLATLEAQGVMYKQVSDDAPPSQNIQKDAVILPGATPQPLHNLPVNHAIRDMPISDLLGLLQHQTEQSLARIKSGQLNHLITTTDQQQVNVPFNIMVDIPIITAQGPEVIPLKIEEQHHQNTNQKSWSITFAASLTELGDIQGKVTLTDATVDVQINAEKNDTIELLGPHQQTFASLIAESGLSLAGWNLRHGLEENHIDTSSMKLLDIRI